MTFVLPLRACTDNAVAGGKAINLGQMLRAGFPVPDGFCVTTAAFRACGGRLDRPEIREEIAATWRALGSPVVAVRSSATAEDMAGASMAGQYETVLDVRTEADLLAAVQRCWDSLASERVAAYLAKAGIDRTRVAMAVAVQELAQAEVAGVLFTANPQNGERGEMLVEASWGLGESVVSGAVQPDTLVLDHGTGDVASLVIGSKATAILPGSHAAVEVESSRRSVCCLRPGDVEALWRMGRLVQDHYRMPMDLEWAIAGGRVFLLQSRAITTLGEADERRAVIAGAKSFCRERLAAGRGGWVRHNLGETLPHPTPLTWSVMSRFMSGDGGFGGLYRQVGFKPAPVACREGILDLIGGRIYMDLARGGELFLENYPFAYDLDLLRANPDASQQPPTVFRGGMAEQLRVGRELGGVAAAIAAAATRCEAELEQRIIPEFRAWVAAERARDLAALDGTALIALWRERERRVFDEFAPWSLLPSVIAVQALEDLRPLLAIHWWDEDAREVADLISTPPVADLTITASQGLYDIAAGTMTVAQWLERFGHRGPGEVELASPRWREIPDAVADMAKRLSGGHRPAAHHAERVRQAEAKIAAIRARIPASELPAFDALLGRARHHLRFREDGKHWLMLGSESLRDIGREAGRRLGLGDDVFLLSLAELERALANGFAPRGAVAQRRRRRSAESALRLPQVISAADLDTLGTPPPALGGDRLPAFAISPGQGRGPARIVADPAAPGELGTGYILVCTSTDPSWTPLFVNAAGLVLECGGSLSHGAVVAREMGIPAVVLPGACSSLRPGETITVDGIAGAVLRGEAKPAAPAAGQDPDDVRVAPERVPPPPGPAERRATRLRNQGLLIWSVVLAAFYCSAFMVIPQSWLYDPVMVVLDAIFMPLARAVGYAWTVGIIAGVLSAVLMITQWWLCDMPRLREAKRRADALIAEARALPPTSKRRAALFALAKPAGTRITLSAFVPLCILLGPMMMPFQWFMDRADPGNWNNKPSASQDVTISAEIEGDWLSPVRLEADPALELDMSARPEQTLPPVRATLEKLRESYRRSSPAAPGQPWEVTAAGEQARIAMQADLDAFLEKPLPGQVMQWKLLPPVASGRWSASVVTEGKRRAVRWRQALDPATNLPLLNSDGSAKMEKIIEWIDTKQRMTVHVVLGDYHKPQLKIMRGNLFLPGDEAPDQVIRAVWIDYKEPLKLKEMVFSKPFAWLGWDWEAGWIWIYILIYVPVMFLVKGLLRIP